jgi:hypothetical protein
MKNPNCDGEHCIKQRGEVRVLPTGGDSSAILCRECYWREMMFRHVRNEKLSDDCKFSIPTWESLRVYGAEQPA